MNLPRIRRNILTAAALIIGGICMSAQDFQLPDRHLRQHDNLLANQGNAGISVENTTKYLEALFNEEEEPEFDIYTEGWESGRVNCYANAIVPETADIDVSK